MKEAPGPSTKLTSGSNANNNGDPFQNGSNEVQVLSAPDYGNSQQVRILVQNRGNYLLENNSNINVGNGLQNDQMQHNDVSLQNNRKGRNIDYQQDFQVQNYHSNTIGINFSSSASKASTGK